MNNLLRTFKERRDSDEGFTLIELMVVVLIIGILLAIAVPTFLNAQNNAKTKSATSNLRSALSSVKTVYADKQSYSTTTADPQITEAILKAAEPSLTWAGGNAAVAVTSPESISFVGSSTVMALATRSALGECFYIIDSVDPVGGGTTYGKKTGNNTDCTATTVTTGFTSSGTSPKVAGW